MRHGLATPTARAFVALLPSAVENLATLLTARGGGGLAADRSGRIAADGPR
jgi:hypothetical protein